jgi:hypothetical protein
MIVSGSAVAQAANIVANMTITRPSANVFFMRFSSYSRWSYL